MSLSTWLIYVVSVLVLTVTPGPSVLMSVSTSVNLGIRKALLAALGSTTAIVGIMGLSALGLGAALAASESLFAVLRWIGAAYLAYIGLTSLFSAQTRLVVPGAMMEGSGPSVFLRGLFVGASNPKALLFFGALFPQFINPDAPRPPQFLILGITFVFFELSWLSIYTLTAARARRWLEEPQRARRFNQLTGAVFLVIAGLLARGGKSAA